MQASASLKALQIRTDGVISVNRFAEIANVAAGMNLMDLDLGAIQEQHHFLKSTTIPAGTYENQQHDIQTVGMDVLLLCRSDLPEPLDGTT